MGLQPVSEDPVQLLKRIAEGDREAFEQFYSRYATLALTFASRLLWLRADAEELLQDVFLQVWRNAKAYDVTRGSPEAWIITITRSRAIDKLRSVRRKERRVMTVEDPSELEGSEAIEARSDSRMALDAKLTVNSALSQLPEAQRTVIALAYFDGLTQSEIATRLGLPLGTVKTRIRDGLQRLRGFVAAQGTGRPT